MNRVRINDLVLGVNIALGERPISACEAFDCTGSGTVPINCLIQGVNNSLNGCPAVETPTGTPVGTATATVTPTNGGEATPTSTVGGGDATPTSTVGEATPTSTVASVPTPTATVVVACPLEPGAYTTTQVAGGTLQVYSFAPFAFPVGGTIVQDVGSGDADCVHESVVPFPGGFTAPNFCVQALMFTTSVTQTGCGVGEIDSNGGSDFTVDTVADTSDSSSTCNLPNTPCTANDHAARVDITVGDDAPDTCPNGGTANALVSIPVHTVSWVDIGGGTFMGCQGNGVFETGDMVAAEFDQVLDFTTDGSTGKWDDIDDDGCSIAGFGPAFGFVASASTESKCIDLEANTVTVAAVGQFGALGGLNDGSFKTVLPSSLSGPEAPLGATCAEPPIINFTGSATRCIP